MLTLALFLLGGQGLFAEPAAAAGPCDPPVNEIVCENSKDGTPDSVWDVDGSGDPSIQGFATDISVDRGERVHFKIDTDSTAYHLDIYRMGYYGGDGARKVAANVTPSAKLPQHQPDCDTDAETGLVDCGNWAESASWAVPANAVSGIYFAKLVRTDRGSDGSHIVFVVRNDDSHSDLLFQTSDTTWEAYNRYGGNSLYVGGPATDPGRAYEVSYNRPLETRGPTPEDNPFNAEYPMVRWLERNGYDVSYFTGVDADRRGEEILNHKTYLSVGHDEYWSGTQRENVEAAREAGVNLAFFSGNEVFWKTRWADSIDGSGTDRRTLVCYKETHANAKIDPESDVWTGTWQDPRFSPPADGGQPPNALTGTLFAVNSGTTAIQVPAAFGKLRFWRNTGLASMEPGETATLAAETLGYEWDEDADNGFRPDGLADLSSTTVEAPERLLDQGSNYGPGTVTHSLTLYRAPSDALVFGAGTVQWSWGLDPEHDRGGPSSADPRMQQATVNLLADMDSQPRTLQAGLVAATATTDTQPPSTTIASPTDGGEVESGETVTIAGTASDEEGEAAGGRIAGVEVSTDDGDSWSPAEGRAQWSYTWTPGPTGETTILARAVDDSGNLEASSDEAEVEVTPPACPCSIWDDSFTAQEDADPVAVELGVRFRSDVDGVITGIRYYKTAGNTGTHVGRLWTNDGTQLAEATFTGESDSGWQTVTFDAPVPIEAGTTYVASYHAPHGNYASVGHYFSIVGADNPPLHALADGVAGPNGIFNYGPSGGLFEGSGPEGFESENYLVDVVFEAEAESDTTPPEVNASLPPDGAVEVSVNAPATATFSEAMDPASIDTATVKLEGPSGEPVATEVSYDAGQRRVTLKPSDPLQYSSQYTATVKGGSGGVRDVAGNHLAEDSTWSFTTEAAPPPSPGDGPGGPILVIASPGNPFSRYYAEILRAEGMNEFIVRNLSAITPTTLGEYDVAILGEVGVSGSQAAMLQTWVAGGGHLIAMRPDPDLAGLLGLSSGGGQLANAYMKIDTGSSPGAGLVDQTIQFHGTADRYTASDAQTIATLYSGASTATSNPAVTLREVGSDGGEAAAFTYDLARSVVYTRQGNPAWAGDDRDGNPPIRPDDLFYGGKAGDSQPDWVDLNKVAIPQADEQQRLLTNLIEQMNVDRKPLPRFWFLPRDEKAAIVMTGDDHGNGGTIGRFEQYEADSPAGCVVAEWQCVRSTSYVFPRTPITDTEAASFTAAGFEIALHTLTNCSNWGSQSELEGIYSTQLQDLATTFPSIPTPVTNRTHCIVWSDWDSQPKVELENGIRLDTTYYYWPGSWVQDRPGMFTGSGMPMRFAGEDGSLIDVYQAATQMTDESEQTYPDTVDTLLDNALSSKGYYGVFTANMHTDLIESEDSDAVVAAAQARGVPVVSAKQMLTWLDGRNQSSFGSVEWSGDNLSFTIDPGPGAEGLRAMLPVSSAIGPLQTIYRDGTPVPTTVETIKGIEYAFFDAEAGSYTATYVDEAAPTISNVQATVGGDGTATITWDTDEPSDSRVEYGPDPGALTSSAADSTLVTAHSVHLSGLEPNTAYSFRISSADDESNTVTDPNPLLAPRSFTTPPAPPLLSATAPPSPANQNAPLLIGSATAGTTVSVYAGSSCSGSPVATATPAELEAGVAVSVSDNSTTGFRATAASGAGVSACSAPIAYVEDSSAPDTQITTHPTDPSNAPTAEFGFTGDDGAGSGIARFECRVDDGAFAECNPGDQLTGLADGHHTFEVRAIDAADNVDGTSASYGWVVDTTAPTATIGQRPPTLTKDTVAHFELSGDDGSGSGVKGFQCRLDSEEEGAWAECHSPQDFSGLAEGSHSFEVRAIDTAGNTGAPASATWTVDVTPPAVQVGSGPEGLTGDATPTFAFSSEPGATFECSISAGEPDFKACSDADSHTPASPLADGSYTFTVRATDAAGNRATATRGFELDATPPGATISQHPPELTRSVSASFEFTGEDPGGSGVDFYECRLDDGEFGECESGVAYGSLADGPHTFAVRAVDQAGNTGAPVTATWTVDTTPPQVTITQPPPALVNSANAEFEFTGDDPGGSGDVSFECRRDTDDPLGWQPCKSPLTYTSLAEGAHSFEVRATDQIGNVGEPTSYGWQIDTVAPQTTLGDRPPATSGSASASFTFSGTDPGGSGVEGFECKLDAGEFDECESGVSYDSLADGQHSFAVRAVDKASNEDQSAETFTWTVDTTAPTASITDHPADPVSSASAHFEFSGDDGSGSGIAKLQCRLDSAEQSEWADCPSPQNLSGLAEGSHSFQVRAVDQAGNTGAPASFEWTVDTTPPNPGIDSGPEGPTNDATPTFAFHLGEAGATALCSISAGAPDFKACSDESSHTPAEPLADGSYTFSLRVTDAAGNEAVVTRSLAVDTAAPSTQITQRPEDPVSSATAHFEFSGNDGSGSGIERFECRLDSAEESEWAECPSPQDLDGLAEGPHTFQVRAIDKASNTGAAASFGWTVDTTPPAPGIDTGPSGPTNDTTPTFAFHPGEAGATALCSISAGEPDFKDCSDAGSHTPAEPLAAGAYTFSLKVTDAAGNEAVVTRSFEVDTAAPVASISDHPLLIAGATTAKFELSGNDGSGSGIEGFECKLDSGEFDECQSGVEYDSLAEGQHTFQVRAVDKAGNTGAPASFGWTVDTTAPTTQLGDHPPATSGSASASFTFSGDDGSGSGIEDFECKLDAGEFVECSSGAVHYADLADGSHSFEVKAVDRAGNEDASAESFGWTVDTTAPTATITARPEDPVSSASAHFEFSGEDGSGSGIAKLQCRLDSEQESEWADCSSPQDLSDLADGPHSFEVRAIDKAGNTGAPVSFGWTVDTTPPAPGIDTGPQGPTNDTTPTFAFHPGEAGATALCSISAGAPDFKACSDEGSHTPAEPLAAGAYTFSLRVTDAAGNEAVVTRSFEVDTAAPVTSISDHPLPIAGAATAHFEFSGEDGSGSGVEKLQCRLDSEEAGEWADCSSPQNLSGLAEGPHTFQVRAVDKAGNTGEAASFEWTVDTTAPQTTLGTHPPATSGSASASFTFSGNDGSGSGIEGFECKLDAGEFDECESGVSYNSLADGQHSFAVRAVDKAGNEDQSAESFTWTVDTTVPTVTITQSPGDLVKSATAHFELSGDDGSGSGIDRLECKLDDAEFDECQSVVEYAGLTDGSHGFEVRAVDKAGNTGAPATATWTVDTTPPAPGIDSGPSGPTGDATPTFAFHAEAGVTFECSISAGEPDFKACSDEGSHTPAEPLADGSYTFSLKATDEAGNEAVVSHSFEVDTAAPVASISNHPTDPVSSATAHFELSGDDGSGSGIDRLECKLDDAEFDECQAAVEYDSLADGSHGFEVRAVDKAGNVGEPTSYQWQIDTVAPTTQLGDHPPATSGSASASFTFSGADPGGSGVEGFQCKLDAGEFGKCSTGVKYDSLAEGSHSFAVRAVDKAGNTGEAASFEWTVDTTAPQTTLGTHPPATSGSASASFTFSGNDGSGSGIEGFECKLDAGEFDECESGVSYDSLADGQHSFAVRAVDKAGNEDASAEVFSWTVDTTAPEATITKHPNDPVSSATAHFEFSGNDGSGSGIERFECRLDSAEESEWAECPSPQNLDGLAEGPHSFQVRAIDKASNTGAAASFGWTVDTTPPAPGITGPSGPTQDATPTFGFSSEPNVTFECSISAGEPDFKACSDAGSHTPAEPLADGSYTFSLRVMDAAGNQATVSRSFEVDTAAPVASISDHPLLITGATTAELTFSGADSGGSGIDRFECKLDDAEFDECDSGISYTDLAEGSHTFQVHAVDKAGNTGPPDTASWTVDTTPPAPGIDTGPSGSTNDTTPTFAFHPGEAGATVLCSISAGEPDFKACSDESSHTPAEPLAAGAYTFSLRVTDAAGNQATVTRSFEVDTAAPVASISDHPLPIAGATTAKFEFTGDDGSGSGIEDFECKLDSGEFVECDSGISYDSLAEGQHSFAVRAIDKAGNTGAPASFGWTVDTTAPQTTLGEHPPATSGSDSASFTFSGNDGSGSGIEDFECKLDSGEFVECSSGAVHYADLADGSHSFEVKAVDRAGNEDASAESFGWTVDTTAPTAQITKHPNDPVSSATAHFELSGDDGSGSGVDKLQCRLDSEQESEWADCSSPQDLSDLADGQHSFEVRAVDKAGNTGAAASFGWTVDTTPPTPGIDTGPQGPTNDATPTFAFHPGEAGATALCSISAGEPDFKACSDADSHTPASPLAAGSYTFSLKVTDAAGNEAVVTRSFEVDTAAPQAPELSATEPASPANENHPVLSGSAAAGMTVALYDNPACEGSPIATVTADELAAGVEVSVGDDTTTRFAATATSAAQNTSACSAPLAYLEDSSAPSAQLGATHPPAISASAAASFSFEGTDEQGSGIARFECKLDSGSFEECSSGKTYSSLSDGPHTFAVRAVDKAGNVGQGSESFEWTVDSTAPTTQITDQPAAISPSASAKFEFTVDDGSGSGIASRQCRRDAEEWAACSSPRTYTSLAEGAHSFEVRATDQAGNVGEPTRYEWQIDTKAPETTLGDHPPATSGSDSASFTFSGADPGGSGIKGFECKLDSGSFGECSSGVEYEDLSDGQHSFAVRAVDKAGNEDASAEAFGWTVDTTAPTAEITQQPGSLVKSATAHFELSGDDGAGSGIAKLQCRLDSEQESEWADCSSPQDPSGLADGQHSFEVRAIDQAGNTGAPDTASWTVDTTPPAPGIDSGPSGPTGDTTPTFAFHAGEASATALCSISAGEPDFKDCSDAGSHTPAEPLAAGAYTFSLKVIDAAGNEAVVTRSFEVDTAAPSTQITQRPEDPIKSATAHFEFSGNDGSGSGIERFECRLDSGEFEECESGIEYDSLADGSHAFAVRAVDKAGNTGAPDTTTWTVDTTPPQTAIELTPPETTGSTSAEFTFNGDDGSGSGIDRFECRLDDGAFGECHTGVQYTDLAGGGHTFQVRAVDKAGNTGEAVSFEWTVDTAAPNVQVDSGPSGPTQDATPTFGFSSEPNVTFECSISAGEPDFKACSNADSHTPAEPLADGSYTFSVRATDQTGNKGTATRGFQVDTSLPDTTIDQHPNPVVKSDTAHFTFTGDDPDSSGVERFECRLDAGAFEECSSPENLSDLADGQHSFAVRAIDRAGNEDGDPAVVSWTVDTTAPEATITKHPNDPVSSATAHFELSGDDGAGSGIDKLQCRLDSEQESEWADCSSPQDLSGLADGQHSFEVRAVDKAGNTGAPVSFGWTVDTTPPAPGIDTGPSGPTNDTTPTFAFHAEAGVTFECSISAGEPDFKACSDEGSHTPPEPLAAGSYTFSLRVTDAAGNQATVTRSFEVDTAAPQAPELSATEPASPANENHPVLSGSAPAGTAVTIYDNPACQGSPIATVTADELAAGVEVSVGDDTTTRFAATATSAAQNTSACSAPLAYLEDSSAPETTIPQHPGTLVNSASAHLAFSGEDGAGSGIERFECRLDSEQESEWAECPSPQDLSGLTDGEHSFEVRATDRAGNTDSSAATVTWTVDTTAPTTQITDQPAAISPSASAKFEFTAEDGSGSGIALRQCRRDAEEWAACSSPRTYTSLAEGAHSFEVRATDQAGNVGEPTRYEWQIDTKAPETTLGDHPPATSGSDSASFTFSGADGSGSGIGRFECRLDDGSFGDCNPGVKYENLAEGAHTFQVRAVDKAGNEDASAEAFGWTVDTTAPTAQIDSLSKTLLKAGEASQVSWHADENGSFQLRVGGTDCGSGAVVDSGGYGSQPDPRSSEVEAADLQEGANTLRLCVTDAAGNRGQAEAALSLDATAPAVTISDHPLPITGATTAELTFSGDDGSGSGIDRFECKLDSGEFVECESGVSYDSLAEGPHTFQVHAVDQAGNTGEAASYGWTVDTTAPTTQLGDHPPATSGSASASFTFSGADPGGSGIKGFECKLDSGEFVECSSGVQYTDLSEGSHSFAVRAVDQAGNEDASAEAYSWTVDTTAPTTEITKHPAGLVNSTTAHFELSGNDGSGSGIDRFQCKLDSGEFEECESGVQYTDLANGSHTFQVRAVDKAGNTGAAASFEWTVDTAAPNVQVDSGPSGPTQDATPTFGFSSEPNVTFECSISAGEPDFKACSDEGSHTPAEPLVDGSYTFSVRAANQAGNQAVATREFEVDTAAPATTLGEHPPATSGSASASFAFSGNDGPGSGIERFECRLDSGEFDECESGVHYADLADGSHSFEVKAVDQAGNEDASAEAFSWTVDTTAPTAQITQRPGDPVSSATAHFELSGDDGSGSGVAKLQCRLDSAQESEWADCSSPQDLSGLADGQHSFQVRAVDKAGNIGAPDTASWTVDTTPPAPGIDTGPSGPTGDTTPTFAFHAGEAGATALCSISAGEPDFKACSDAGSHTPAEPLAAGSYTFSLRVTDAAGNQATVTRSFEVDTAAPAAPQLSATEPASPANENHPVLSGSAPVGTAVTIYDNPTCQGSPIATVTADELAAGVEVSVGDDTTTSFAAKATSAAQNTSACSAPLAYLEDSSAPDTTIDSSPDAVVDSSQASFAFSGSDASSAVDRFECRIDSEDPGAWQTCGSPATYTSLAVGAHTFEVRAVDQAGNPDASPASFTWAVGVAKPDGPAPATPAAIEVTPEGPADNGARFVKIVRNPKRGGALLLFHVSAPGTLSLRPQTLALAQAQGGRGNAARRRDLRLKQKTTRPVRVRVAKAGTIAIPVRLTRIGRTMLSQSRRIKVRVVARYQAPDGSSTIWKMSITLRLRQQDAIRRTKGSHSHR